MTTQASVPGDRSTWSSDDHNKLSEAVAELQGIANGGSLSAIGDVTIESDTDASAAGDIVIKTGGVERARISASGQITGVAAANAVPTLEELTASTYSPTSLTVTISEPVWVAPFACKVTQASVVLWNNALTASDTNYWTVDVRRTRANSAAVIATKTTQVTQPGGGVIAEAFANRTDWNFDSCTWSATNQVFQKGDIVSFAWTATGSPTATGPKVYSLRYEPS